MSGQKRTAAGMRELLFDLIDGVNSGRITDTKARTIATVATTILKSVEVELQFRAQQMAFDKLGNTSQLGELELVPHGTPTSDATLKLADPGKPVFVPGRAMSGSR